MRRSQDGLKCFVASSGGRNVCKLRLRCHYTFRETHRGRMSIINIVRIRFKKVRVLEILSSDTFDVSMSIVIHWYICSTVRFVFNKINKKKKKKTFFFLQT